MLKLKISKIVYGVPYVRFNQSSVYLGKEVLTVKDTNNEVTAVMTINGYAEVPIILGYTYIESMVSGEGSKFSMVADNINYELGYVEFSASSRICKPKISCVA